jgi:hypothetical protein
LSGELTVVTENPVRWLSNPIGDGTFWSGEGSSQGIRSGLEI